MTRIHHEYASLINTEINNNDDKFTAFVIFHEFKNFFYASFFLRWLLFENEALFLRTNNKQKSIK